MKHRNTLHPIYSTVIAAFTLSLNICNICLALSPPSFIISIIKSIGVLNIPFSREFNISALRFGNIVLAASSKALVILFPYFKEV